MQHPVEPTTIVIKKMEISFKVFTRKQKREPVSVVGPHLIVWNLFDPKPLRPHFFRFSRLAPKFRPAKYVHFQYLRLVPKRKVKNPPLLYVGHHNFAFFPNLSLYPLFQGFPLFHFSSKPIPAPLSKAATLHTQKYMGIIMDNA